VYALDTNTVIYYLRDIGRVGDRLEAVERSSVAVSTLVVYELQVGLIRSRASSRRHNQLSQFLAAVSVLPFGEREARAAAAVRANLEDAGTPIGPVDNLIAGTALVHDAVLVTHNVREFSRVPGLRVEDWY
jgi:tRNA(fMet)-specific endonuclease VapC